jgi:hypothetical protein
MTNKLRYNMIWAAALCTILSFGACEDSLNLQPKSEIGEGVFYKNDQEINLAVISSYNSLQSLMQYEWLVTENRSDNTNMNASSSESQDLPMRELDRFVQNSQNIYVEKYWRAAYHTIAMANTILDRIDVVTDPALKNRYEAEARFLRAFSYFRLVRLFGAVFIIDTRITGEEAKSYERQSEAAVYDFIVEDLKMAAADGNLPQDVITAEKGRLSQYAAQAELAEVYITRRSGNDLSDAKALLTSIKESTKFALQTTYASVFSTTNEYNNEILFAVRYKSGSVGLGSPFANWFAPKSSDNYVVNGNGLGYNYPTQSLGIAYEAGDTRKDVSMGESYFGKSGKVVVDSYIKKYLSTVTTALDAENDWPIIRYADVLLMLAEVTNDLDGPSDETLDLLNQVHQRAGLSAIVLTNVNTPFGFRLALENERRLEFAFENKRWFDLLRTKRAITVMNQHFRAEFQYNDPIHPSFKTNDLNEWQLLLPIPQFERDLNPAITQNYGY